MWDWDYKYPEFCNMFFILSINWLQHLHWFYHSINLYFGATFTFSFLFLKLWFLVLKMLKPHELSALFLNSSFPSTAPDTLQFVYISFFSLASRTPWFHYGFHIRSFRSSLFITATNCANSTTKEGGLLKSTCTTGHCLLIYI